MRHLFRAATRMTGLCAAAALVATTMMTLAPRVAAAANGGQSMPVHASVTQPLELSTAECRAYAASAPVAVDRPGRTPCVAKLTVTIDVAPATQPVRGADALAALSSGCTTTWVIRSLTATVQSAFWGFFWSATANATGYGDSCGRVMWTSVSCDQHGIGYSVKIDWCGAYPGTWAWYGYTLTNMGLNITVSAVANGTPIAFTHGARNGFNPYTGTAYNFFAW